MSSESDKEDLAVAEHERTAELNQMGGDHSAKDDLTAAYNILAETVGKEREEIFELIGKAMAHIDDAKQGLGW